MYGLASGNTHGGKLEHPFSLPLVSTSGSCTSRATERASRGAVQKCTREREDGKEEGDRGRTGKEIEREREGDDTWERRRSRGGCWQRHLLIARSNPASNPRRTLRPPSRALSLSLSARASPAAKRKPQSCTSCTPSPRDSIILITHSTADDSRRIRGNAAPVDLLPRI